MGVLRTVATLTVSLVVATGMGCSDKSSELEDTRTRVTVGSERDATTEVRSEPLGFALAPPAEGWKLLDGEQAAALADGAAAGALGPGTVAAAVLVSPTATQDVNEWAKVRLAQLLGEVPPLSEIDVHEARGRGYAVTSAGLRRAGALWIRAGMGYELRVWGLGDGVDDAVAKLLGSMSEFDKKGPVVIPPMADRSGADWRVSAGVYENAASGLRIDTTQGLRLVVGSHDDADVVIEGSEQPMSLMIASEPTSSSAARAGRLERVGQQVAGEPHDPLEVEVLGAKIKLTQRSVAGATVAYGDVCDDESCHAILARYGGDDAKATLLAGLASVGTLNAERRKALTAELATEASHRCAVSDGYALRGDVYRSFENGVTLVAPAWTLNVGHAARRRVPGALVFLEARRLGLEGALLVDDKAGEDEAAHHQAVLAVLAERGGVQANDPPTKVKGNLVSRGADKAGLSFVVATHIVDGRGVQLSVWGASDRVKENDAAIVQLIEGLSAGVEKAVETPPGGYLDRRLGVSAAMPVGWRMQVETPAELAEIGTYVTWEMDGRFVGLTAMCLPPGASAKWSARYLEQRLRSRLGRHARGGLTAATRPMAGTDAHASSWHATLERVDTLVFTRGNAVFAIASSDHTGEALDKAAASFAFID